MYPPKVTSYALISLAYISGLPEEFLLSTWTKISTCRQTRAREYLLQMEPHPTQYSSTNVVSWDGQAMHHYAVGNFSQNHLLANSASANTIACVNLPTSVWSNVVYQLSFVHQGNVHINVEFN